MNDTTPKAAPKAAAFQYYQVRTLPSGRNLLFRCGPFMAPLRPKIETAEQASCFGQLVAMRELGSPWRLVAVVQVGNGRPVFRTAEVIAEDQAEIASAPQLSGHLSDDSLPQVVR